MLHGLAGKQYLHGMSNNNYMHRPWHGRAMITDVYHKAQDILYVNIAKEAQEALSRLGPEPS